MGRKRSSLRRPNFDACISMIRIFFYPDSRRYVLFTESSLEHMYDHMQHWPWQKEAGGEIFSAEPDAAGLIITAATGPNPKDRRSRHSWNPDTAAADRDRQIEYALDRHAVGLWHTHPEASPSPSLQDRETTGEYLNAFLGQRSRYLMVIVGNRGMPPSMTVWSCASASGVRWEALTEVPEADHSMLQKQIR